jgi:hypothetical protein
MGFFEFIIACVGISTVGSVLNSFIRYRQKVAELKLKSGGKNDQNSLVEMRALRNEMMELRDTSTEYNLSFDTALQRMESRITRLEQRIGQVEQETHTARLDSGH